MVSSVLKLETTHEEAALIGVALANMPYRQVAQLMQKLETQIRAQVEQKEQPQPVKESNT